MRGALQGSCHEAYLRPLLTSHVLLGDHAAALQLIKQVCMIACSCTEEAALGCCLWC